MKTICKYSHIFCSHSPQFMLTTVICLKRGGQNIKCYILKLLVQLHKTVLILTCLDHPYKLAGYRLFFKQIPS